MSRSVDLRTTAYRRLARRPGRGRETEEMLCMRMSTKFSPPRIFARFCSGVVPAGSASSSVLLSRPVEGVLVLTLNRAAKRNALSAELISELQAALSYFGNKCNLFVTFHLFAFSRDEENFNFTLQFFFEADDSRAIVGGGGGDERAEGQPEEESMGTFVDQAMGGGVM